MIHDSSAGINKVLYEKLKEVAKKGGHVYYEDVAPLVHLNLNEIKDRNELSNMLGLISEHEHNKGMPMLSAVVVKKDTKLPGSGFFELAHQLGLFKGVDKEKFFYSEIKKVWNAWRK